MKAYRNVFFDVDMDLFQEAKDTHAGNWSVGIKAHHTAGACGTCQAATHPAAP